MSLFLHALSLLYLFFVLSCLFVSLFFHVLSLLSRAPFTANLGFYLQMTWASLQGKFTDTVYLYTVLIYQWRKHCLLKWFTDIVHVLIYWHREHLYIVLIYWHREYVSVVLWQGVFVYCTALEEFVSCTDWQTQGVCLLCCDIGSICILYCFTIQKNLHPVLIDWQMNNLYTVVSDLHIQEEAFIFFKNVFLTRDVWHTCML